MGFRISWLAAKGIGKADFLSLLDLADTGADTREVDEAMEAPFCCAELPTGWTVLWANDFDFASPDRAAELSKQAPILACCVHEGIMVSMAGGFDKGAMDWALVHISEEGPEHLFVQGTPPAGFEALRDAALALQEADGPDGEADHVFDVPLQMAQQLCGFRHDQWQFEWGEPVFTVAAPRSA